MHTGTPIMPAIMDKLPENAPEEGTIKKLILADYSPQIAEQQMKESMRVVLSSIGFTGSLDRCTDTLAEAATEFITR